MKLLIDADILIHKAAASCTYMSSLTFDGPNDIEVMDLEAAKLHFISLLDEIRMRTHFDPSEAEVFLAVTVGASFRREINPEYKSNRPTHSTLVHKLRDWVLKEMDGVCAPGIEADDILGMHQTEDTVICTEDKDLLQIPGHHYNWRTGMCFDVTPDEAERSFWKQVLSGDSSDNYPGCPGVGPVKAHKSVEAIRDLSHAWEIVVLAYEINGKTRADALMNAQMAWILHPEDQPDYRWTPESHEAKRRKPCGETQDP